MSLITNPHPTAKLPGTAAWLLAALLLLTLLCAGSLARLAFAPAQASRPVAPAPTRILPSSWRPQSP